MKSHFYSKMILAILFAGLSLIVDFPVQAQITNGFNYSGQLNLGGTGANGVYDFQFAIYDSSTNGNCLGVVTNNSVVVTNGLFNTIIAPGNVFTGANRWLDIGVRTGGVLFFTPLSPRQPILPLPYADYAVTAGTVTGTISVTNLPAAVALLTSNQVFTGTVSAPIFIGDGSRLTNLPPTVLVTNSSGVMPGIQYFGALGGTNDDTIAIQAAANYGHPVWFGDGVYTCSNIILTNNSQFYGSRARLVFKTNASGYQFLIPTNCPGIILKGLIFDGGYVGQQGSGAGATTNAWSWYDAPQFMVIPHQGVLRTAVGFPAATTLARIEITECSAINFSGVGFEASGGFPLYPIPNFATTLLRDLSALNCYIGFCFTNGAEDLCPFNLCGQQNGIGLYIAAGNEFFTGGIFTDNGIAVWVAGNNVINAAHGSCINMNLNHNDIGIICDNWFQCYEFDNCQLEGGLSGGNWLRLTNCAGFHWHGGALGTTRIIVDGGNGTLSGYNYIEQTLKKANWTNQLSNGGLLEDSMNILINDANGNPIYTKQTLTNTFNIAYAGTNTYTLLPNEAGRYSATNVPTFNSGTIFNVTNTGLYQAYIAVTITSNSTAPASLRGFLIFNNVGGGNVIDTIPSLDLTQTPGHAASYSGVLELGPGAVTYNANLSGNPVNAAYNVRASFIKLQ